MRVIDPEHKSQPTFFLRVMDRTFVPNYVIGLAESYLIGLPVEGFVSGTEYEVERGRVYCLSVMHFEGSRVTGCAAPLRQALCFLHHISKVCVRQKI